MLTFWNSVAYSTLYFIFLENWKMKPKSIKISLKHEASAEALLA